MNHAALHSRNNRLLALVTVHLFMVGFLLDAVGETTFMVEAEKSSLNEDWLPKKLQGASNGKVLERKIDRYNWGRAEFQSLPPVFIPGPGKYVCWVRYYKEKPGNSGFFVLLRDENGEEIAFKKCHFQPRIPRMTPYSDHTAPYLKKKGFVWEKFNVTIERPTEMKISLAQYFHGGSRGKPSVDCFLFTTDPKLDPAKMDIASLASFKIAKSDSEKKQNVAVPKGFVISPGFSVNTSFFSPIKDPHKQFSLVMVNNSSLYRDYARLVQLGFNEDHNQSSERYGVTGTKRASAFHKLDKKYAKPDGFFVNSKGTVSKRMYSLCFPPLVEHLPENMEKLIGPFIKDKNVRFWTIAGEAGGYMDYSPYAVKAFRNWLEKKYPNIGALNKNWQTNYKDFKDIQPPKSTEENLAAWLEFRNFSGEVYARAVGRQIPIIHQLDPLKRSCIAQCSNLNLLAPYFTSMRPLEFEQFNRIALKGEKYLAWDGYSADDFIACEFDLLQSLAPEKKLIIGEWNTHTPDPRILARTAWGVISKGLKGLTAFQFQEGTNHNSYPKWAFLNNDFTPKKKLGALADIAHEIKRIEPLLLSAKRSAPVKPVAMYYPQIDLALAQPESSLWGAGHDNPYRIYAVLRGLGYSVCWITSRQISEGKLAEMGALVMADCQYVPAEAAIKIDTWVKNGGAVIADRWPGARDEYGRPQAILSKLFGVKSSPKTAANKQIAVEEAVTGYGPETGNAFNPEKLTQTIIEIYQQWDAKPSHPVAETIGNFMLSGYGYERVKCTSGTVIGMAYDRGNPGIVLNEYGKGKTLYFAALMGTLFDGSATRYEWDSTHSGLSFGRILDAFLSYAGVKHLAEIKDLPPRAKVKIRVEAPLVTPDGNALIGITSMNDMPVGPFELSVALPENARKFGMVLVSTGGSRQLTRLPFKVANGRLHLKVPVFDTHAALLSLHSFRPLIGLEVNGGKRGDAGLEQVSPSSTLSVIATIYNPSDRLLPKGNAHLYIPKGWFMNKEQISVDEIKPWGKRTVEFTVKTPLYCGRKRLRPIVVKYGSGSIQSTPATELVWWMPTSRSRRPTRKRSE